MSSSQIEPNPLAVSVGVQTHPGRERTENQDRVTRAPSPFGDLFVLADGVGGYLGGAEAAQVVVDGYSSYLSAHGDLPLHEALQQATRSISAELAQRLSATHAEQGLGSTVVLCIVAGTRVTYAHVGDSRIYLVRDRQLQQLTRDHSVMERMVSHGILTPEQARNHPNASALTRALGLSTEAAIDIAEIEIRPGDALLLCSDGLWAYAPQAEIEAIVSSESLSASGVAEALLNLALEGGGGDNISIQFLQFTASALTPIVQPKPSRSGKTLILGITAAAVLGGGALGVFLWNQSHPLTSQVIAGLPQAVKATAAATAVIKSAATAADPGSSGDSSTQTIRTPVRIVTAKGKGPEWASRLKSLNYLQPLQQAGSEECLTLRRSSATLFYAHRKRGVALDVQRDLPTAHIEIAELPDDEPGLCGGEELFALPGDPALAQGAARGAKTKVDKANSSIESVTKATKDQLEKHLPH